MSRTQTYADILLNLPVDDTLKTFIERYAMPLPEGWIWHDSIQASKSLVGLIQVHPNVAMRDRIVAGLHAITLLAHPLGKQAMFQAAHDRPTELMGLIACKNDLHRAFWLYVHHPALFEAAAEIEYLDHHGQQAQQHDLGLKGTIKRDEVSIAAFGDAIKGFYQRELGCGEVCVVNVLDRARGTQLVSIHAKDLATAKLEFEGSQLQRRVGSPNIHMVLEYAQATGVARTIIRGGAKYHAMLCEAFARHLLGVDVDAQRIQTPRLNLSTLRLGLNIPQAIDDGFVGLQVKSVTVVSGCGRLKMECTASASSDQRCVTELLQDYFGAENPLARGWTIQAAVLNFYLAPMRGKSRCQVVSVEVTSKGRLNLHKFDEKLRAQLEGYLVQLGILKAQQILKTEREQEEPATMDGSLFE
ncbi:MAG: hypothetical protein ACK5BY_01530 [Limnohabitans sp.]|uniref:hypothetical protein n=1 Tax=Limnohabitans sp. TaxID=1907725 RepID=UPI00391C7EF4